MDLFKSTKDSHMFQPIFIISMAVITCLWVTKELFQAGTIDVLVEAVSIFFLMLISSFAVFSYWKIVRRNEIALVLGTYLIWLFIVPLIWVILNKGVLYAYGFLINRCCEENEFLTITIWETLNSLTEGSLTPILFSALLIYISFWLLQNILSSKLKFIVKGLALISIVTFFISFTLSISTI